MGIAVIIGTFGPRALLAQPQSRNLGVPATSSIPASLTPELDAARIDLQARAGIPQYIVMGYRLGYPLPLCTSTRLPPVLRPTGTALYQAISAAATFLLYDITLTRDAHGLAAGRSAYCLALTPAAGLGVRRR